MSALTEQIQEILVQNSPKIPGLRFRPYLGKADFSNMAGIINAANAADNDKNVATVEEIARNYKHLQRSDTDKDMLFAEIDGEAVAYGRCQWSHVKDGQESYYQYFLFVHLKPEWRGTGLGKAMGEYFIERIEEIAAGHPADTAKKLETYASNTLPWHQKFAEQLGFKIVRYGISMTRPCSEPVEVLPLPAGLEVRPVGEEHYRMVFNATMEAFRDHWHFVEPTEADYKNWLENPRLSPSLWKVAWDGDQIAGQVLNFINHKENEDFSRKRGYTEGISTQRAWRRRGVARSLLTQSIKMFQDMGMEETSLGVDTENPSGALNLYTSVGYTEERRFITYQRPLK